jgi:predicted acyl esterase
MKMRGAGEVGIERDLMVPVRNGIGLATDVYRPAGGRPFPVLLERTPYDKSAPSTPNPPLPFKFPRSLLIGRAFQEISERGRGWPTPSRG